MKENINGLGPTQFDLRLGWAQIENSPNQISI